MNALRILTVAILLGLTVTDSQGNLTLSIVPQKQSYYQGEPIVIRGTIENLREDGSLDFEISWGFGLAMLVAKGGGEIYSIYEHIPFPFSGPPIRNDFFLGDRYAVWGHLAKNQPVQRIDLFIAEPGNYRIKYALRDPSTRKPIGVESNEIAISVVPIDPGDIILKVVQENELKYLEENFYYAFYFGSAGVNFGRGESRREFLPVLREIIEDCTDSAYYEAACICHALSAGRNRSLPGKPITDLYSKAFAEQFLTRFPESWFRVEVGETLIQTYLYEGDTDRALATYNLLIAEQPNSVLLKNRNIEKRIDERIQKQ